MSSPHNFIICFGGAGSSSTEWMQHTLTSTAGQQHCDFTGMSEHIRRDMQSSRDLPAVPIPPEHPANVPCVSRHRIEDTQHSIHNRDRSPLRRSRSSVSRRAGDDITSPGKNGKNLPPLPRSRTQTHFPHFGGSCARPGSTHRARSRSVQKRRPHRPQDRSLPRRTRHDRDSRSFSRDRGTSSRRGHSGYPDEFSGSVSQVHLPAWAMVPQKKGREAVKDSRPLSPPPGNFNVVPKFYIEGAVAKATPPGPLVPLDRTTRNVPEKDGDELLPAKDDLFHKNLAAMRNQVGPPGPIRQLRTQMTVPDYDWVKEKLSLSRDRAQWIYPMYQLACQLRNSDPFVQEVKLRLEQKCPSNQDYPPESALYTLTKAIIAASFPLACILKFIPHEFEGRRIWKIPVTGMPGYLQTHDTNKNAYVWCHATSPAGLIGVLKQGIVAPTCRDQVWMDRPLSGFFGTATYDLAEENILRIILQRSQAGKNSSGFIISGRVVASHRRVASGGVVQEQQEVEECLLTHRPRDRRWCIHFNHTVIDHIWFIEPCSGSGPARLDEAPESRSQGWSFIMPPNPQLMEFSLG